MFTGLNGYLKLCCRNLSWLQFPDDDSLWLHEAWKVYILFRAAIHRTWHRQSGKMLSDCTASVTVTMSTHAGAASYRLLLVALAVENQHTQSQTQGLAGRQTCECSTVRASAVICGSAPQCRARRVWGGHQTRDPHSAASACCRLSSTPPSCHHGVQSTQSLLT